MYRTKTRRQGVRIAQERRMAAVEADLRRRGISLVESSPAAVPVDAAPDVDTVARVIERLWAGAPAVERPLLVPIESLCEDAGVDGYALVQVLQALERRYGLLTIRRLTAGEALVVLRPLPPELVVR